METDSRPPSSPQNRVVQRLLQNGIPLGQQDQSPWRLVMLMRENKSLVSMLVSSLLPAEQEALKTRKLAEREPGGGVGTCQALYAESLHWMQWMMFQGDPLVFLRNMREKCSDQRAVCGVVWGRDDLAYRCRTCEHDPTCAICVACFQNGNHADHDYSIIYTGGGCCDCGDETAWKREGFCSKHKGSTQIKPLPEEIISSVGPVLDALLVCWMDKVLLAEQRINAKVNNYINNKKIAEELSSAVIEMLLEFCNCSESLLSFIGRRMLECSGLLNLLVRAERFLDKIVVMKLHELLLKLLGGDSVFKYEFAKILIDYYPVIVKELTEESSDSMLEKYPLLSSFSVQIFTVPSLTVQLVREVNLLGVLLGCLTDVFMSFVAEDGRLQASKWGGVHETTIRLVEDIRYVMSHSEVPIYIAKEIPNISISWMRLLSLLQGMDPLKRATSIHIEEDYDKLYAPFVLGHYLGNVHNLMVVGAYSVSSFEETNLSVRKDLLSIDNRSSMGIERLSQENDACNVHAKSETSSSSNLMNSEVKVYRQNSAAFPPFALWLIIECLKTIESWLEQEYGQRNLKATSSSHSKFWALRKKLFRTRKGSSSNKVRRTAISSASINDNLVHRTGEDHEMLSSSPTYGEREVLSHANDPMDVSNTKDEYPGSSWMSPVPDNGAMELDSAMGFDEFSLLNTADWPDTDYDVKSQEISFHIPLHRLLSSLFRKALNISYGETGKWDKASGNSSISSSRSLEFFGQVLKVVNPCGFSAYIMEHPLRLRVFCAQVLAGMWRKNGEVAVLSSEWYRSVQWFEQGLESDLFLLQCCASLAPPESFVKRIQERFGLSSYSSLDLADNDEYEPVLVQEMLTLIIQVVKERRFCGLSTTENLRRELVYKLSVGDATHSQLVKALPRDISKSSELRDILDVLASYSKPSSVKQGKYSLRKDFWKELDLYHPRWNSRDLQIAVERYSHACKVSALNFQLPRWTPIFDPLSSVSRIATSKAVLQIIRAVVFYAVFTKMTSISRASEGALMTALHLLSLGLDICETQLSSDGQLGMGSSRETYSLFPILTYASEEFDGGVADEVLWKNQSLLSLLVSLLRKCKEDDGHSNAETGQFNFVPLIENLLKKFAELSSACMGNLKQLAPELVCLPCYSPATTNQNSASTSDMEERKARARKHQAAIMEKMRTQQSKFIASLNSEVNDDLDNTKSNPESSIPEVGHLNEESAAVCSLCRGPSTKSPLCFFVLLQKSRLTHIVERGPISWKDVHQSQKEACSSREEEKTELSDSGTSIQLQSYGLLPADANMTQESFNKWISEISDAGQPNASDKFVASSLSLEVLEDEVCKSVIREINGTHVVDGLKRSAVLESSVLGDDTAFISSKSFSHSSKDRIFSSRGCDGIHISSCGHAVHKECHDRYLVSLKQRRHHRIGFEGAHVVDPDLGELLCPVCRRFANSILPALTGSSKKAFRNTESSSGCPTSREISQIILTPTDIDNKKLRLGLALSLIHTTSKMVNKSRYPKLFVGEQRVTLDPALAPAINKLCVLYWSRSYSDLSSSGRLSPSLTLWDTLRYSLISSEIAARGKVNKCSTGSTSLDSLYGQLQSSSGFILSLLLSVAQTARSSNHRDVFLRFKTVELLSGSVCSGMSTDDCFSSSYKLQGTLSSMLKHVDKGEVFPDIEFCKQAADPILARDPFSSLMWVLFCLPVPLISSSDLFTALVHLFYVVCVTQALITCNTGHYDDSCFSNCALNDTCKAMGKLDFVRKYFVSNYIDSSCNPTDMVRRFTLPYLRRCALLWKLLQSSTVSPLYDCSHIWEGSTALKFSSSDAADCLRIELTGIKELEDMFHIHSLESVLEDDLVHCLALRWCQHFVQDFRDRNCGAALFLTPAVPFKLMQLPRLYQDVLQRYVKLKCSYCNTVPEDPALCLLCGALCSPGWKQCCSSSRCLNHATTCGAGIGVFLLIRRTTILLHRSLRQAFWPSPYLDAFGEEDNDVSRGRPLYLNEERYASLTYLVASHGLDRTSEVLSQTTLGLNGMD